MKKIAAFFCSVVLLLSLSVSAFAADNKVYNMYDAPPEAWFFEDVFYAWQKGWVDGKDDGRFYPETNITKAEFLKVLMIYLGYEPKETPSDPWYKEYMQAAVAKGLIEDDSHPEDYVTRLDAAIMLYNIFEIEALPCERDLKTPYSDIDDVRVTKLFYLDIMKGVVTMEELKFLGDDYINRCQLCAMLVRADKNKSIFYYMLNPSAAVYNPTKYSDNGYFPEIPDSYNKYIDNNENDAEIFLYMSLNQKISAPLYLTDEYEPTFAMNRLDEMLDVCTYMHTAYPDLFRMHEGWGYSMDYNIEVPEAPDAVMSGSFYMKPLSSWSIERTFAERARLFDGASNVIAALYQNGDLKSTMTETEKANVIITWVINNNEYDKSLADSSHYGSKAFTDGKIVCDGYASLCCALFRIEGIECYGVEGEVDGGGHMWNIIKLDGKWRMFDATFMDAHYVSLERNKIYVRDDNYFLITPQQLIDHEKSIGNERTINWETFEYLLPDEVEAMKTGS